MRKPLILFLIVALFGQGCKEDIGNSSWDVNLLAPVIRTSLNVGDLLNDTILTNDADGKLRLLIEQDLFDLPFDSILRIPDTSIVKPISLPVNITATPGFTTPVFQDITLYELDGKSIKLVRVRAGNLNVKFTNQLETEVRFDYSVQSAPLGGVPISISEWLDANSGNAETRSIDIDLAGYTFDLRGPNGTGFNQLVSEYSLTTDPKGSTIEIVSMSPLFDLEYTFSDISLEYGIGYFGQENVSTENDTSTLDGMQNIVAGNLFLDSVTVDLKIINGVGMDGIFQLNGLSGLNTRSNTNVDLTHSLIGDPILLTRAQDMNGTAEGVQKMELNYHLDNSNSNVKAFIENLPDQLSFAFDMGLNPLGNVSAGNDFFYYDSPFEALIKVDIPLNVRVDDIVLQDTLEWDLGQGNTVESINFGTLTMIVNNGFPLIGEPQLVMLDSNFNFIDTLLFPATVLAPQLDGNGKVIGPIESRITIDLPADKMDLLPQTRYVIIRMRFETVNQPELITFYSDYTMDIQLVGNFNYTFKP